jgi:ribonuclease P protein subunit POP4
LIAITPHNILRHELIGLNVIVASSKDPSMKGIRGTVVDETKNMLTIASKENQMLVPKSISTFRFKLPDRTLVEVDGARLVASPENRLKIRVKRW